MTHGFEFQVDLTLERAHCSTNYVSEIGFMYRVIHKTIKNYSYPLRHQTSKCTKYFTLKGGRDAAIVSNIPGTTRDVIETCMNIHGFPVIFADTAGIRHSTTDSIENEGVIHIILSRYCTN